MEALGVVKLSCGTEGNLHLTRERPKRNRGSVRSLSRTPYQVISILCGEIGGERRQPGYQRRSGRGVRLEQLTILMRLIVPLLQVSLPTSDSGDQVSAGRDS